MAHTIHKFFIDPSQKSKDIEITTGAVFLSAQQQYGKIALWYAVDPEQEYTETRTLHAVETNGVIPHPREGRAMEFRGTQVFEEGRYVLHVFDEFPYTPPGLVIGTTRLAGGEQH